MADRMPQNPNWQKPISVASKLSSYIGFRQWKIIRQDNRQEVILLAIEDITDKKELEQLTKDAESNINAILETLVGSTERYSGGTAPQPKNKKDEA